jgi:hypothetical protein
MIVGNVATFCNTLALRLFQISHETSMMRVTRDFLRTPLEYMKLIHHSFTVVQVFFFPKTRKWRLIFELGDIRDVVEFLSSSY